jgi:Outer membrane protein beta-barrel domain
MIFSFTECNAFFFYFVIPCMRNLLTFALLTLVVHATAQKQSQWQLSVQLQPELTVHQNQYWSIVYEKQRITTFNMGIASALQYNLTNRLFVDIGLGYISRKLNTSVILVQSTLPEPHFSATKELNITRFLSYNTIQIPVNIGYKIINNNNFSSSIMAGMSANYLLSAKYKVGNPQYDATYAKGYWQGLSVNAGIGTDIRLSKKISLTNSFTWSFIYAVRKDHFLKHTAVEGGKGLPHDYLKWSVGIKKAL